MKKVFDLDDVYLYTVDDLGDFIPRDLSLKPSLEDAEDILEVEKFMNWFQSQNRINTITHLNNEIKALKEKELASALSLINKGNPQKRFLQNLVILLQKSFHIAVRAFEKNR